MLSLVSEACPSRVARLEFDSVTTVYASILQLEPRVDDRVRFEYVETAARCRLIPPGHFRLSVDMRLDIIDSRCLDSAFERLLPLFRYECLLSNIKSHIDWMVGNLAYVTCCFYHELLYFCRVYNYVGYLFI